MMSWMAAAAVISCLNKIVSDYGSAMSQVTSVPLSFFDEYVRSCVCVLNFCPDLSK